MIGAHQAANRAQGWRMTGLRWLAALAVLGIRIHFCRCTFCAKRSSAYPGPGLLPFFSVIAWRMVVNATGARLG
jgi:hypothetical protein